MKKFGFIVNTKSNYFFSNNKKKSFIIKINNVIIHKGKQNHVLYNLYNYKYNYLVHWLLQTVACVRHGQNFIFLTFSLLDEGILLN